jgi:hypothetical protein
MQNKITVIYREQNNETDATLLVNDHVIFETGEPDDGADISQEIENIEFMSRNLAKALNATVMTISKN